MSELFVLEAQTRETTGKSATRALRNEGKLPATVYSKGKAAISIAIDYKLVTSRYVQGRFKTQICDIALNGKTIKAIPKELSLHPVTDNIEHIDFYSLEKNQKIHIKIPIKFINSSKSVGVKRGGVVNIGSRDIELICTLSNIPKEVIVDLESLQIGQSVHQSNVELPKGVEIVSKNANVTVVAVTGRSAGDEDEDKTESSAAEPAEKKD